MMNDRTFDALQGSIRKWEMIVAGMGVDEGPDNCPLCREFYFCKDCPVEGAVKANGSCRGTPYRDWDKHRIYVHDDVWPGRILCPECARLAQRELDFLRSLLPDIATPDRDW